MWLSLRGAYAGSLSAWLLKELALPPGIYALAVASVSIYQGRQPYGVKLPVSRRAFEM